MVQLLLRQGANVNTESKQGCTPLHVAPNENHLDVVWFLARQGATPASRTTTNTADVSRSAFDFRKNHYTVRQSHRFSTKGEETKTASKDDKVIVEACGDVDEDDSDSDEEEEMFVEAHESFEHKMAEWGGPRRGGRLPEPTRFGDWERKGRCTDF